MLIHSMLFRVSQKQKLTIRSGLVGGSTHELILRFALAKRVQSGQSKLRTISAI